MSAPNIGSSKKDTIYIDVDDEITAVVEKIRDSSSGIVALVLPKRATVFQSVVNMKLLKRSADDAKKRIVLITSEQNILSLAGLTGVYVAKTLQTKPYVPPAPTSHNAAEQTAKSAFGEPNPAAVDKTKTLNELMGDDSEVIKIGEDDKQEPAKTARTKFNKKLKIPNFEKFRTKLILAGVALVLLVGGLYYANAIAPTARIKVVADTQRIESNIELTASPGVDQADIEKNVVPAAREEIRKTDSEKSPATGKKDIGEKAEGSLELTNCIDDGEEHTLPAGTVFSSDGLDFATKDPVTLEPAIFSGNNCREDLYESLGYVESVDVIAVKPGDAYNLTPRAYASSVAGILAEGSEMTGGTSEVITVVSKSDVDKATQKVRERLESAARSELLETFQQNSSIGLSDTLKANDPIVGTTPNVNAEAGEVTVTYTATYSMLGAPVDALEKLIEEDVKDDIDTSRQGITDSGLDSAVIRLLDTTPDSGARISIRTLVTAGPDIDEEALKQEIAGKKRGETQTILNSYPGVRDVTIDYSPFWVFSTPSRTNKIELIIEQPPQQTQPEDNEQQ